MEKLDERLYDLLTGPREILLAVLRANAERAGRMWRLLRQPAVAVRIIPPEATVEQDRLGLRRQPCHAGTAGGHVGEE